MVDKLELNKEDPQVTKAVESKDEPKPAAKKTGYLSEIDGVEVDFELQYRDRETDMKDIAKRVTEDYVNRGNDPATIELVFLFL